MSTATAQRIPFDKHLYHEQVSQLWTPILRRFHRWIKGRVLFNAVFLLIALGEIGLFLSCFAFLSQSSILAFLLALFFLTLFSYFVLRLYLQAKTPERLSELCDEYLARCKEMMHYQEGIPEHHIGLANVAHKFAMFLREKEYSFYTPPLFTHSLSGVMEKFSSFCHWKDVHILREALLMAAVEEHLKVVKCEPTNLEVHAALANAYVMLSSLYADPRKYEGHDEERWIPPERLSSKMQEQFRATAERAMEEFHILNDYAPDDPWVHMQLAYSYHDLQMPQEEIREYEIMLKLRPEDKDTLFKLGVLYFQQGKNAQGLKIYEMLKRTHYRKAESLIKFYGSFETSL